MKRAQEEENTPAVRFFFFFLGVCMYGMYLWVNVRMYVCMGVCMGVCM